MFIEIPILMALVLNLVLVAWVGYRRAIRSRAAYEYWLADHDLPSELVAELERGEVLRMIEKNGDAPTTDAMAPTRPDPDGMTRLLCQASVNAYMCLSFLEVRNEEDANIRDAVQQGLAEALTAVAPGWERGDGSTWS